VRRDAVPVEPFVATTALGDFTHRKAVDQKAAPSGRGIAGVGGPLPAFVVARTESMRSGVAMSRNAETRVARVARNVGRAGTPA
jgi:hypothetical protein